MSVISWRTRIERNPRVVFRELADGTGVLLHLDTAAYHGVNETGALTWTLLDTDRTFDELIGDIRERVTPSPPHLAYDISTFLEGLADRGLVTLQPEE